MRFKIDWASFKVGNKFTVFALFYFVFEGNFPSTTPREAYIWRGDFTEGFFALPVVGGGGGALIDGGAHFRNFTVVYLHDDVISLQLPESFSSMFSCGI